VSCVQEPPDVWASVAVPYSRPATKVAVSKDAIFMGDFLFSSPRRLMWRGRKVQPGVR
jgi:hypothetical protein